MKRRKIAEDCQRLKVQRLELNQTKHMVLFHWIDQVSKMPSSTLQLIQAREPLYIAQVRFPLSMNHVFFALNWLKNETNSVVHFTCDNVFWREKSTYTEQMSPESQLVGISGWNRFWRRWPCRWVHSPPVSGKATARRRWRHWARVSSDTRRRTTSTCSSQTKTT